MGVDKGDEKVMRVRGSYTVNTVQGTKRNNQMVVSFRKRRKKEATMRKNQYKRKKIQTHKDART